MKKATDFENWLTYKFDEEYHGSDEHAPDAFNEWLQRLDIYELIQYGDEYAKEKYENPK